MESSSRDERLALLGSARWACSNEFGAPCRPTIIMPWGESLGASVPSRFGRYDYPYRLPSEFRMVSAYGWRIALPRNMSSRTEQNFLVSLYKYGPPAVGYVQIKDTLVPANLGPGERYMLATTAYAA